VNLAPFLPDTPVLWSISGGLTSGYMLRRRLDLGPQRDGEFFVYANTGKERQETLDFLHEIETRWGVDLVWLQRTPGGGIERVTYETAARQGEPFAQLIDERGYLPNVVARFCTVELKIRTIGKFARLMGMTDRLLAIGLRADEMHRVVRLRGVTREQGEEAIMPLADAGVTLADVEGFWAAQPFTLNLSRYEGNCDLCFLKGQSKVLRILSAEPSRADWWINQEAKGRASKPSGARFRSDRPSYARLKANAVSQGALPLIENELGDLGECSCTD